MKIRKIKKSELEEVSKIFKKEFNRPPYKDKWTKQEAIHSIKSDLKNGDGFVAVENEKVIGFIIFTKESIDRDYIFIENIVVDSKHQKKRIGKKLVKMVEDKYRDSVITLSVNKKSGAYNFYKKLGFTELKERKKGATPLYLDLVSDVKFRA